MDERKEEDGFLTIVLHNKGWKDKYTQLSGLWITTAAVFGIASGLASGLYLPQMTIPAAIAGTFLGAILVFLILKRLDRPQKRD